MHGVEQKTKIQRIELKKKKKSKTDRRARKYLTERCVQNENAETDAKKKLTLFFLYTMLRPGLVCRHFVDDSFSEMLTVAGQRVVAAADSVRGVEHVNEISNGHS